MEMIYVYIYIKVLIWLHSSMHSFTCLVLLNNKIWICDRNNFKNKILMEYFEQVRICYNQNLRKQNTEWYQCIFTRGQFWPSGIVIACVCLSVCVSVCVCVRQPRNCPRHNSPRVQARTTKFGQKVHNNLVKVPIVLGAIDLDLQGQI